jgi:hypothetical protein
MAEAVLLLDLDASAFIGSVEVEEADGGVALGLELEGEDDCAKADDSISPLNAVVINNF